MTVLKLKRCVNIQLKISFLIRPDPYKTQQMCDKSVLENYGTLESVPDCFRNPQMRDKAIDNHPHSLEFDPDCYKTQKMGNKIVNSYPST